MLNTNVYCRPFDDKSDAEIKSESDHAEEIINLAELKKFKIIASDILYAELSLINDMRKRDIVFNEIKSLTDEIVIADSKIHELARELNNIMSDYSDDLHIASAAVSGCEFLVTCDKQLIRLRSKIETFLLSKGHKLSIVTPKEFISSYQD